MLGVVTFLLTAHYLEAVLLSVQSCSWTPLRPQLETLPATRSTLLATLRQKLMFWVHVERIGQVLLRQVFFSTFVRFPWGVQKDLRRVIHSGYGEKQAKRALPGSFWHAAGLDHRAAS